MKKIILFLFMTVNIFTQEIFTVAINNAPPYRIIKGKNYSGIYIDIINEVAKEAGIQLKFVEVPYQRALEEMKSGKIDIMLGPNKNKEREVYMYFLEKYPFPREVKVFYYMNKSINIENYEDLYGKKIDVLRGAKYFEKFDNDTKLIKNPVSDYVQGLNKVRTGRSDLVIIPELQGDYLLKENKLQYFNKSKLKIDGNLSFVTVSKKSKKFNFLVEKLNLGLEKVNKKNYYKKVIDSYKNY